MENNSIAFITCVNDEKMYGECCRYIDNLNVPNGYKIEKIPVRNSRSITSGYNEAIERSKSRYKVYIHQDVFIINKNFIEDTLNIFQKDRSIGLLGVIGAEVLSTNAIWWESKHLIGKTYEIRSEGINLLHFNNAKDEESYYEVQCVDGLIMMTQFDVKWRDDIFNGWHFYDISQCIEFKKAGYKVAIPNQENPWCIHDVGVVNVEEYEEYRQVFIETYSKDIFPLVSILIPTHNRPEYFKIALESAVNQTYKNIEIIVGDNGDDDKTEKIVMDYIARYDFITYIDNKTEENKSQFNNWGAPFRESKGEYISYLLDDDVFHVNKLEKMINYFIQYENVTLVTSYRQLIDETGKFLYDIQATKPIVNDTSIIKGENIGLAMLTSCTNFIGEPSTAIVRRNCINEVFGTYIDKWYEDYDIAQWLECCRKGDVVYIVETLNYFRLHGGNDQFNVNTQVYGCSLLYSIISASYANKQFIVKEDDLKVALARWLSITEPVINNNKAETNQNYLELKRNMIKVKDILQS